MKTNRQEIDRVIKGFEHVEGWFIDEWLKWNPEGNIKTKDTRDYLLFRLLTLQEKEYKRGFKEGLAKYAMPETMDLLDKYRCGEHKKLKALLKGVKDK